MTSREFLERAGAGELIGIRCTKCGDLAIPPRELCPACHHRGWEEARLSGEGTIASYTVIRVAPRGHAGDVPYAIAAVQLKEGVGLLGRVIDIPLDRLAVGLPVRFRPIATGGPAPPRIGFAAA